MSRIDSSSDLSSDVYERIIAQQLERDSREGREVETSRQVSGQHDVERMHSASAEAREIKANLNPGLQADSVNVVNLNGLQEVYKYSIKPQQSYEQLASQFTQGIDPSSLANFNSAAIQSRNSTGIASRGPAPAGNPEPTPNDSIIPEPASKEPQLVQDSLLKYSDPETVAKVDAKTAKLASENFTGRVSDELLVKEGILAKGQSLKSGVNIYVNDKGQFAYDIEVNAGNIDQMNKNGGNFKIGERVQAVYVGKGEDSTTGWKIAQGTNKDAIQKHFNNEFKDAATQLGLSQHDTLAYSGKDSGGNEKYSLNGALELTRGADGNWSRTLDGGYSDPVEKDNIASARADATQRLLDKLSNEQGGSAEAAETKREQAIKKDGATDDDKAKAQAEYEKTLSRLSEENKYANSDLSVERKASLNESLAEAESQIADLQRAVEAMEDGDSKTKLGQELASLTKQLENQKNSLANEVSIKNVQADEISKSVDQLKADILKFTEEHLDLVMNPAYKALLEKFGLNPNDEKYKNGFVAKFGGSWCGACILDEPMVNNFASQGAPIVSIETQSDGDELSSSLSVDLFPTYIRFGRNGGELDRHEGRIPGEVLGDWLN